MILRSRSLVHVFLSCAKVSLATITLRSSENPFLCAVRRQYPMLLNPVRTAFSLA